MSKEDKVAAAPAPRAVPATTASPADRPDTGAMDERELAQAILARAIRPRVGEIRRLAEAVAAKNGKKQGKKDKARKSDKKLAKIPGQKKKKS